MATEVPAAITALGGEELVQARQVFARARYRVELRFNPTLDLTEQHYLVFRSRRLNVGLVTNVNEENVEWISALCGGQVDDGGHDAAGGTHFRFGETRFARSAHPLASRA